MDNNIIDLSLKLIGGRPIVVGGFGEIKPLKLREIIDYGYSKYSNALNIFNITKDSLKETLLKDIDEEDLKSVSNLELLIIMSTEEVLDMISEACVLFFGCHNAHVDTEDFTISLQYDDDVEEFTIIDKDSFDEISEVVRIQNYVQKLEDVKNKGNEDSEEVRKFKERLKRLKEEAERAKRKRDGDNDDDEETKIGLYEIISSVSTKSNISDIEIMELTIYQIYTKFKRLEVVSKYDVDIQSILAGAKDIKLKHWSTRIKG